MILAYIDESGTNYSKDANGYFNFDGPYAIWSAVLITEKKYFDIERSFQDLAKKYLGRNIRTHELHATEIWRSRNSTIDQKEKVKRYFEELIQLTAKLHIPVVFGIQQKNPSFRRNNKYGKELELEKARYSLLTLLEHKLSELNETAILVSDNESTKEELKNLVFNRTKWRYNPPINKPNGKIKPKYLFEYQSNFIIDQLHYVDSQDSLLMQFADHICFVLRKSLEHLYLLHFSKQGRPIANKDLVPITDSTFNTFVNFCNLECGSYKDSIDDVNIMNFNLIENSPFLFSIPTS